MMINNMEKVNEIMKIMDLINYGYIDDKGINIFDNDDNVELEFSKKYRLMSPDELLSKKYGVCWDQVELERKLFEDNNINVTTYFIYIDDKFYLPSHTFLVYNKNNKFYWFEHSWYDEKGIHEYNCLNDLLNDVEDKFIQSHKAELLNKDFVSYIYKYKKPSFNINCDEFYEFIYKQEKVYNYKLINASNKDEKRLKYYKLKTITDYVHDLNDEIMIKINSYINKNVPEQINKYKNIVYNNELIGSVLINESDNGLLIDELFIEERYRNKGIGTSIIKTIIENYNLNIYSWVYKENKKAFNLYKSLGFFIKDETNSRYYMEFLKRSK